jgi:hypothetical protein
MKMKEFKSAEETIKAWITESGGHADDEKC